MQRGHCLKRQWPNGSRLAARSVMLLSTNVIGLVIAIVVVLMWLFISVNILREYERAVVFRLGHLVDREKGPGVVIILWPIETMVRVSLRVVTWDVPAQD